MERFYVIEDNSSDKTKYEWIWINYEILNNINANNLLIYFYENIINSNLLITTIKINIIIIIKILNK